MGAMGGGISLGSLFVEVSAVVDDALNALQKFGDDVGRMIDEQKSKWDELSTVGDSFLKVGGLLTAGITAPLVGLGAAAVSTSEEINQARVAFTTMLGSGQAADQMLKDLQAFAQSTPFEFPDLVKSAQQMQALGFSADQIIPTLTAVGDHVASMGGGKENVEAITRALGQMQAATKVTAQDMLQLTSQGVPAWQTLADAAGVTVPEAMKLAEQGAIRSADAIPAILAGMANKSGGAMEEMSKTLTGQWSNLKDSLVQVLTPIGQALTPALTGLVQAMQPLIGVAADAVKWFNGLPTPVQNAALALGAMAAALGPLVAAIGGMVLALGTLMPVLEGLAAFFGTSVLAIGGWAAAIGVAAAALVALGTWVYQNWDSIVATLKQAWDGIQEAWGAIWDGITSWISGVWSGFTGLITSVFGPVIEALKPIWDAISGAWTTAWTTITTAMSTVWNGISGFLGGVWNGILDTAKSVWGEISGAINTFLTWCEKIPGVNKLFNLDDAWRSAEHLGESTKQATAEIKKTAPTVKIATTAVKAHTNATKDLKDEIQRLKDDGILATDAEIKVHKDSVNQAATAYRALTKAQADGEANWANLLASLDDFAQKGQALGTTILNQMTPPAKELAQAAKDIGINFGQIPGPLGATGEALKTLGITSQQELTNIAEKAQAAYDAIKGDPNVSDSVKNNALIKVMEAQRAAAVANGEQIPATFDQMMQDIQKKINDANKGVPSFASKFHDFANDVGKAVGQLGVDLANSLFEGDMSWAEKGKAALKSITEAFTNVFIKPVTDAIGELIAGALKDLIGGKGFGGVLDSITNVGKGITSVFGSASGGVQGMTPTGGLPGMPDMGGGAGGAAGGAGGATSGLGSITGVVGAVGSAVSAISGVIGNFQSMAMNKSLDIIVLHTLQTANDLANLRRDEWDRFTGSDYTVMGRMGEIIQRLDHANDNGNLSIMKFDDMITALGSIRDSASNGLTALSSIADQSMQQSTWLERVAARLDAVVAGQEKQINVTMTGSDPAIVASKLATQLRLQGAVT